MNSAYILAGLLVVVYIYNRKGTGYTAARLDEFSAIDEINRTDSQLSFRCQMGSSSACNAFYERNQTVQSGSKF